MEPRRASGSRALSAPPIVILFMGNHGVVVLAGKNGSEAY